MVIRDRIKFTLRLRLFLFFIILVITILLGVLIILFVSGNIIAGLGKSEIFIKNEHAVIFKKTAALYDDLAAEAVGFSRSVSMSIEERLREKNLSINDLKTNPELLKEIVSNSFHQVIFYLHRSKSSGAFIILDATVNNKLLNFENSKAGIYIKNMEPNIISSSSPTIYLLRGVADVAYKNELPLHSQWRMEFNVANAPYYHLHMDKSQKSESLSNRFYWSEAFIFPETSEKIMMCSVPLIDTEGNVFGVCGFDVSYMLFKMSNMPDSNMYNRIFCLFAPVENNVLKMDGSLFSGGYFARSLINNQDLKIASGKKSLYVYENDESSFIGYHRLLKLYPEKSLFVDREWALALMVPQDDINSFVVKTNLKLIYISTILMIIGIIIAFILSKYYIIPIARGIDIIKNNPKARIKTNVLEIDELIEFLLNKGTSSEKEIDPNSIILNDFLKNIRSLSPAERSVFNLYAQQYNAKEISENLYLSINTIKTHTKHIYSKLNITSKEELILYVEILKETGRDIK